MFSNVVALLDEVGSANGSAREDTSSRGTSPLNGINAKVMPLSNPLTHEIAVRRITVLSKDRSFDARGSFVHFAHHGLQNNILTTQDYMEGGTARTLLRSGWYDSETSASLRRVLNDRRFSTVSFTCLLVALFCSDLFELCQVPTNTELDAILSAAFLLFLAEFVCLNLADKSYPMSFFFLMDIMGTFSMIFDISFMLGPDATSPDRLLDSKSGSSGNVMIMRAARAARLGARAGRLSRVAKLLRFLQPGNQEEGKQVKMAKVISNKLSDVLSIRVAFLTICLAVVLPAFAVFEYPDMDESLIAWPKMVVADAENYKDALARNATAAALKARKVLDNDLARFVAFFQSTSYGPFWACLGHSAAGLFECAPEAPQLLLHSTFSAPRRRSSILEMCDGTVQVFYDLSAPRQLEAAMSIGLVCFIILVMVGFSMLLSSSITAIALMPLERMLAVVRQRCAQIFKYTNELQEDEESDAKADLGLTEDDSGQVQPNEFALLEKAVSKLAAIAHLSVTKDALTIKEEMTENDIMVLNWMQGGHQVPNRATKDSGSGSSSARLSARSERSQQSLLLLRQKSLGLERMVSQMSHFGSTLQNQIKKVPEQVVATLATPDFDAFDLTKEWKLILSSYIISTSEGSADFVQTMVPETTLTRFVIMAEKNYLQNPFHNFSHGLDVLYSVAFSMRRIEAERCLPEHAQFWLLVAALGHDLGHIGVNNQFLVETSHELAVTYNDRSPLENLHCSRLFQIVNAPDTNVFAEIEKDLYREMRKGIIDAILHTDITKHNEMVKELTLLYQMNSDVFDGADASQEAPDLLKGHTQVMANALLHLADVGNPMKPWELCLKQSYLCLDEFFAQGDREKELSIPVQMLNDRDKVNRPNSQIGFIEFMMAPFVEAMVMIFPPLDGLAMHMGRNIEKWAAKWIDEASPPEDAADKVKARVLKVIAKCESLVREDTMDSSRPAWLKNARGWRVE